MSSAHSIANLSYITRHELAERIRQKDPSVTVIDVRDSDYIGGHIIGCLNVPTQQHDFRMPELVRQLGDQNTVVFHCALSQQRGPASALKYLRERERQRANGQLSGSELNGGQKVYVLDGGFVKWQESYGEDPALTEGYVKDIWQYD